MLAGLYQRSPCRVVFPRPPADEGPPINPAIAQGIAAHVGSVEVGKLADLVVCRRLFSA